MKRLFVIAALALAACDVGAPAGTSVTERAAADRLPTENVLADMPEKQRLDLVREEMFNRINAASVEGYKENKYNYPMTQSLYDRALAGFDKGDFGVWCYGNAVMLAERYRRDGGEALVVSFGLEGGLTHAGVFVKSDGDWYYHDAYFNFTIDTPFLDAIAAAADGKELEFRHGADLVRRMRVTAPEQARFQDPNADCSDLKTAQTCEVNFTVTPHMTSPLWLSSFERQEQAGLQGNLTGMFRLPFAVFDGVQYMTEHPLLDEIAARSGCRGGQVATCAEVGKGE